MHGSVCEQYTFQPGNKSTFNALHFDKTLSHTSVKKKTKNLVNGFRFRTLDTQWDTTLIADWLLQQEWKIFTSENKNKPL